jgi:hypothetical protein
MKAPAARGPSGSWLGCSARIIKLKPIFRRILLGVACVLTITVSGIGALIWYRTWNPFMDDGPFHGIPCEVTPTRSPDQNFVLFDSLVLESYDRRQGEPAPTVLLRQPGGQVQWCIRATAVENTDVQTIRFHAHRGFPFQRPRVRGLVDWTYGNESTWWFIRRDGTLEEYWVSW